MSVSGAQVSWALQIKTFDWSSPCRACLHVCKPRTYVLLYLGWDLVLRAWWHEKSRPRVGLHWISRLLSSCASNLGVCMHRMSPGWEEHRVVTNSLWSSRVLGPSLALSSIILTVWQCIVIQCSYIWTSMCHMTCTYSVLDNFDEVRAACIILWSLCVHAIGSTNALTYESTCRHICSKLHAYKERKLRGRYKAS